MISKKYHWISSIDVQSDRTSRGPLSITIAVQCSSLSTMPFICRLPVLVYNITVTYVPILLSGTQSSHFTSIKITYIKRTEKQYWWGYVVRKRTIHYRWQFTSSTLYGNNMKIFSKEVRLYLPSDSSIPLLGISAPNTKSLFETSYILTQWFCSKIQCNNSFRSIEMNK